VRLPLSYFRSPFSLFQNAATAVSFPIAARNDILHVLPFGIKLLYAKFTPFRVQYPEEKSLAALSNV
jgi:hypothetical protein